MTLIFCARSSGEDRSYDTKGVTGTEGAHQVGTDQFTESLPAHLRDTGCEMGLLRQVAGPSGTAVILLQPNGEPAAS